MDQNNRYLFWAHSPIGYETYLSLKDLGILNNGNSHLITARDCMPPEAECSIGLPEEYCWMSPKQFDRTQSLVSDFLKKIDFKNNFYELIIPQTANFFIRSLIESERCKNFIIFDEGSSARAPLFTRRCNEIFYKYKIRNEKAELSFFSATVTDFQTISKLYEKSVPFYDLNHKKFSGHISFFKDAFPEKSVSLITKSNFSGKSYCKNHGLILLPPFHVWLRKEEFQKKFQTALYSLKNIARLNPGMKWIFKFHPHDTDEIKNKFKSLLNFEEFNDFCIRKKISNHREPAFMGFDVYVSAPNSTTEFLRSDKNQFIAIAI